MSQNVDRRPSTVHGTGVFAIVPIVEGTLIGRYTGNPTAVDSTYVLWVEGDDGAWTGVDGIGVLRFLNHSRDPNVEFDGADLYALTDISADDELLFHYGEEWADIP